MKRPQDKNHLKRLQPIVDFYNHLRDAAIHSEQLNLDQVLAQSRQLGIRPLDAAIGIFQPALNEIGQLFAEGKVSAAREHAFTSFVDRVVTRLRENQASPESMQPSPRVLLVCINGNYHWLGLKFLELALLDENIPTRLFIPSLPTSEIIDLALELRPEVIGVSIFGASQASEAQVISNGIRLVADGKFLPKIVVGGHGARVYLDSFNADMRHEGDVSYFRQAYSFTESLKNQLKKVS